MASGIISKVTDQNKSYYSANDVMNLMGVSRNKAYTMIRGLREELVQTGQLSSVYPAGRIPKSYFNKKCMIGGI